MKRISQLEKQIDGWRSNTQIEGLGPLLELDDGTITTEIAEQVDLLEEILEKRN